MRSHLDRASLATALREEPDSTLASLALRFDSSRTSVGRALKKFGLRTKTWSERRHSPETREKIRRARIGRFCGAENPNFGKRSRPWLEGDRHPLRRWHAAHPEFGQSQTGARNPVHSARHLYNDPLYVARITRGIRAHVDQKRGSTYTEVYGAEKALSYREKLRAASPARLQKYSRKDTAPEREMRRLLEEIRVIFRTQEALGYHTVDFFVEDRLVVQVDGDFWHGNPSKYAPDALSPRQRKQHRIDASCNSYLEARGYGLLRVWESEIQHARDAVRTRIVRALEET